MFGTLLIGSGMDFNFEFDWIDGRYVVNNTNPHHFMPFFDFLNVLIKYPLSATVQNNSIRQQKLRPPSQRLQGQRHDFVKQM